MSKIKVMIALAGRTFPRGVGDFVMQLGIWFGFFFAYQIARGFSDRGAAEAIENGRRVIEVERALHTFIEVDIQRVLLATGEVLVDAVNYTYWLSQFAVLGLALLWIYFRRNEHFYTVRNWVIAANVIALIGYVAMPTAPPRMFWTEGFIDTLAVFAGLNHESGLIQLASNPYAAMPSVHSADAFIIGFAMASLVKSRFATAVWTLWPAWVWFSVMATANHFWLDIAAGMAVVVMAAAMVAHFENRGERSPAILSLARR